MEAKTKIARFILQDILAGSREVLDEREPLVGTGGLLDSLGLLRLIQYLEEEFQIRVGDGDVGEENFGSLALLAAYVHRKREEPSS